MRDRPSCGLAMWVSWAVGPSAAALGYTVLFFSFFFFSFFFCITDSIWWEKALLLLLFVSLLTSYLLNIFLLTFCKDFETSSSNYKNDEYHPPFVSPR